MGKLSFFNEVYKQKSSIYLWPSVNLVPSKNIYNPINTYLYCDAIEESILDYKILALYKHSNETDFDKWSKEVVIKHPMLDNCYVTEDGILYVFNLIEKKDLVDKFLNGEYTKFLDKDKKEIINYHITGIPASAGLDFFKKEESFRKDKDHNLFLVSSLYFKDFKEEITKEMVDKYYNTLGEAKQNIDSMKEICPIFNLSRETLNTTI